MQTNPYQTPETPEPREPVAPEAFSDRDKFLVLGGVIFAGLLTFFPWPALLFIALSTPLFYQAFRIERLKRQPDRPPDWREQAALALSSAGMGVGTIAAILGAFYGTCNVGAWATAGLLSGTANGRNGGSPILTGAFIAGPLIGLVGAVITGWFLFSWKSRTVSGDD